MKLGKQPSRIDPRTLKLATILKPVLPPIPASYDFDAQPGAGKIPHPTFSNLSYGDCVIAGRAHQTYRLELKEHKKVVSITTAAVLKEYFKETGGYDDGLVMLDSLNAWRKVGWKTTTGILSYFKKPFKIHAFASVAVQPTQIKQAIYLLNGMQFGLSLPLSAQTQINNGRPWDVIDGPGAEPGSWGGHCVCAVAYNMTSVCCITWGQRQWMTWKFVTRYCDEAYAVVDEAELFTGEKKPGIDVATLESYLNGLKKA